MLGIDGVINLIEDFVFDIGIRHGSPRPQRAGLDKELFSIN